MKLLLISSMANRGLQSGAGLIHHVEEESLTSCWARAGEKLAGVNPTPKSELTGKEMAFRISPLVAWQWDHEHPLE